MTTTINNPVVSAVPIISTTPSCTTTSSISNTLSNVEKECESKPQFVVTPKKPTTNIGVKPITVVKTNPPQSLLQSNQHFPHHQIQVNSSNSRVSTRLLQQSFIITGIDVGWITNHQIIRSFGFTIDAIVRFGQQSQCRNLDLQFNDHISNSKNSKSISTTERNIQSNW